MLRHHKIWTIIFISHPIILPAHKWSKRIMWLNVPQLKLENIWETFLSFYNSTGCKKYLKNNKHNSLHLAQKYATQDICSWTLSVPWSSQFSSSCTLGKLFASQNRLCPWTNIYTMFSHQNLWSVWFIYTIYTMFYN